MKDNLPKPVVPKDPVQIGKTKDGEPIWIEPKDLIPTKDEEQELSANTLSGRKESLVQDLASQVIDKASRFVEQTFLKTASETGLRIWQTGDSVGAVKWAQNAGYEAIQDGLTTIVKLRGKVIRDMYAEIDPRYRESVAMRVNALVKKLPAKI